MAVGLFLDGSRTPIQKLWQGWFVLGWASHVHPTTVEGMFVLGYLGWAPEAYPKTMAGLASSWMGIAGVFKNMAEVVFLGWASQVHPKNGAGFLDGPRRPTQKPLSGVACS